MSLKKIKYSKHPFFMNLALLQAQKSLGNTKDNPAVGCVIVRNNCIISAGSTGSNGTPHAEYNAINSLKKNVKNSDLYVTLEPCSHYGKTPPCVKSIIKSKVKRVFFSIKDPDIRSYNKSIKQFSKKKISVKHGILSKSIKNFYKSYFNYKKKGLPFVTAKLAVSKDFYSINKKGKWITNKFSRGRVHIMRSNHSCVLSSAKTVIDDNPHFTCRIPGLENCSPTRVILDKNLRVPLRSNVIKSAGKIPTIFFFNRVNKKKIKSLKNSKVKLLKTSIDQNGDFDLKKILTKIMLLGFPRIFLESGINLCTSFLDKGLINDFQLFISDKKLGNKGNNNFRKNMYLLLKSKKIINTKVNLFGDKLISYRIK